MIRVMFVLMGFVAACDATNNSCVGDAQSCDADGLILQDCVDGQLVEAENCAESGETCHSDMGPAHCGPADMNPMDNM